MLHYNRISLTRDAKYMKLTTCLKPADLADSATGMKILSLPCEITDEHPSSPAPIVTVKGSPVAFAVERVLMPQGPAIGQAFEQLFSGRGDDYTTAVKWALQIPHPLQVLKNYLPAEVAGAKNLIG